MDVAQENQNLILRVDLVDNPIGLSNKKVSHLQRILHRAFSTFAFREVESSPLLQQCVFQKYRSDELWIDAYCCYAVPGDIETAARNRFQTEIGFSCPTSFLESAYYKTGIGN